MLHTPLKTMSLQLVNSINIPNILYFILYFNTKNSVQS